VEERYPGLKVAGIDSPPIGAVIEWDNEALCEKMRASGARLLLVCLGCPKQERWICAHHHETGIPLSIGVGASLDFITGKQTRAPRWMQRTGMEWFWRMSGSPTRLITRYSKDLAFLLKAALQQARAQRRRKCLGALARNNPPQPPQDDVPLTRLEWRGALQQSVLDGAPLPATVTAPVLLDASRVTFMDSSGLGRLAALARLCRATKQLLFVVSPSVVFKESVRAVRMDALVPMVADEAAALHLIAQHQTSGGGLKIADDGAVWVAFNRPLDALYHDEMIAILETAISATASNKVLVVDLHDVSFMDSRAVGGLIRIWKMMSARGGQMFYAQASPALREIIGLLHLEKILLEWKGPRPT